MIPANVRQWIEIVGGVAIVASVGLLIFEIRQNTDALSTAAVSDLNHQSNESFLAIASNPEFADLFVRAFADESSLSATDRLRGEYYARGMFSRLYTAYSYHQKGILSEASYNAWLRSACDWLKHKEAAPARLWADNRPFQDPEFVREVESYCQQPRS